MPSIVIPAHNEGRVIGRLLVALRDLPTDYEIVVVCNGCTDDTATVSRRELPTATVIELAHGSKPLALNTGDATARSFPRVYLDADVRTSADAIVRLVAAVQDEGFVAAAMTPRYDLTQSSPLVRAHWRVWSAMHTNETALSGTNAMAVTAAGRSRFDNWPNVIGDDYFFDGQFSDHEKSRVPDAIVVRSAPNGVRDCMSRKARIHQGNLDVLAAGLRRPHGGGGALSALSVVRSDPRLVKDLPAHALVTLGSRLLGVWRRRRRTDQVFYRDRSRGD